MLLKIAIKCYCVKNKGGIIYEKIVSRGACLLLALCLSLNAMVNKFLKSRALSLLIIFISMAMIYYVHSNGETKVVLDKAIRICMECIRCGRCKNACPVDAISYGVRK